MFEAAIGRLPSVHSRRRAVWASTLAHVVMVSIALWMFARPPVPESRKPITPTRKVDLVWIPTSGPSGGGGGGGDTSRDAAPARNIGRDRTTVPPPEPNSAVVPNTTEAPPQESIAIAATPRGSAVDSFAGLLAPVSPTTTRGPGTGDGADTGDNSGVGPGSGDGLGDGRDFGSGDAFTPGNRVSTPQLLRDVKPRYTSDAMRARVQGIVRLECVVLPNGRVGDIKILKSLDPRFGLDEEAVSAARQWQFVPGRRLGEPVAVRVVIELGFSLQ
jgi:periplasmic protein TonB